MHCKNCDGLISLSISFCPNCGAKIIRNRLTVKNLFASFAAQFLNYDNKFLQTFVALFKRPEDVIGGYINGVRKKYVNVISYFMIALTITGLEYFILDKFFPDFFDFDSFGKQSQQEMTKTVMDFTKEYQALVMMLMVPLYAMVSRLVFLKNKKFNYTEHLVIFMYVMAQLSIAGAVVVLMTAVFGLDMATISIFISGFQIIYSGYCLKRLYGLSLKGILLKTLLFVVIAVAIYLVLIILFVIVILIMGGPEVLIEMGKAAQQPAG